MTLLLAVIVSAVALALIGLLSATAVRVMRFEEGSKDRSEAFDLIPLVARIAELEAKVERLPSLWEHEVRLAEAAKDEATKQHRKAAAIRRDTEKRPAEGDGDFDPDEEDQATLFLREHARASNGEEMQPVSDGVAGGAVDDLASRAAQAGITPYI